MNIMFESDFRAADTTTRTPSWLKTRHVHFIYDAYCADVHAGIAAHAREAGWKLHEAEGSAPCLDRSIRCDGIIALATQPALTEWLEDQKCPVVRALSATLASSVPVVDFDPVQIGVLAAEHFLNLGGLRCVHYSNGGRETSAGYWQGFSRALASAGRKSHRIDLGKHANLDDRTKRGVSLADRLREIGRPLAIFVEDEHHAQDVLEATTQLGWQAPEDIALLGVDHRESMSPMSEIVSSVETNRCQIGREAAALLDRLMDGEQPPTQPVRVAPGQVVQRRSTSTFVCEHPGITASVNFLRTQFSSPIRLNDIARSGGMSPRTLQHSFKEHVGRTVRDELKRVRLEHAAKLLRETQLKLDAVAYESGLGTATYLCFVFRQAYGMAPGAFRDAFSQSSGM